MPVLRVATCQFPVSADIGANLRWVKRQMTAAARRGARVAHFPEGALSGYAGTDFASFDGFGWDRLAGALGEVREHARRLGIWAVLGSAHRLSPPNRPHNSLYVIDDAGQLADRYDKRFCGGDAAGWSGDLAHYSPGDHLSTWTLDGVRCGALICYDYRFPELYREYAKYGVQLVLHSFHAGNAPASRPDRTPRPGRACGPPSASGPTASRSAGSGGTCPACWSPRWTPGSTSTTRPGRGGTARWRACCTAGRWSAIRARRTGRARSGR